MSFAKEITSTSPIQRAWNKESMVAFINASLLTRSHLDVRYSYVYYDADKDFKYASKEPLSNESQIRMNVRFWSKGIV